MARTYQTVLSVAAFSILKVTFLNPNRKMLLHLFFSDEDGPAMEHIDAHRDFG